MKNSKVLKVILFILGGLLAVLGGWRMFDPVGFYANSGIDLATDIGMLSEARSGGGLVCGMALLIICGAFSRTQAYTSSIVLVVLLLSYAIARLIGVAMDGSNQHVMTAVIIELVLGAVAVFAFLKYREK